MACCPGSDRGRHDLVAITACADEASPPESITLFCARCGAVRRIVQIKPGVPLDDQPAGYIAYIATAGSRTDTGAGDRSDSTDH